MEKIRYNSEPASELIKKLQNITDGSDKDILEETLEKNESAMKILLRKVKLKLKKGDVSSEQKNMLLTYMEQIKKYMDTLDDINLFLEDALESDELEERISLLEEINSLLLETDLRLQKFIIAPTSVTSTLPGREEIPPPSKKKEADSKSAVPKPKPKVEESEGYSSIELLKFTTPPRPRKKLPKEQYERLNNKLQSVGVNLSDIELKKLAECGFDQRVNISVLNRIFETLEEIITNYGESFNERMKTLLLLTSYNHLFMYDISRFYTNFEDPRVEMMEKIVSTLNAGLSITEYLSSIMKVIEIVHLEENDLLEGANIIGDIKLPYEEWIKINEYEINLRYKIRDYWQNWFDMKEKTNEFEEDDYEMIDEEKELFLEKLTFLELKIERLPYALESPWELASWIKELFAVMHDHSFKLQRWTKLKKAELLMGMFNVLEQTFVNPNLYTPIKGENILLKLGRRVEIIQENILGFLRDTVDNLINSWQTYKFYQPLTFLETSILEKGLIALTLSQTAIDQIQSFYKNKNMLDLVFSTQLLSITNELYTLGLTKNSLILENENLKTFVNAFIGFHLDQITQEEFSRATDWITEIINILIKKKEVISQNTEKNSDKCIIEIFIQKALVEYMQGQNDLQMYKQTQMRLFLLTSFYSILQGTNRLMVLKELKDEYMPGDAYYEYFDIMSDLLNTF